MDNVRPLRPKRPPKKPRRDPRTRLRVVFGVIVAVVILVVVFASRILGFYADWLWFGEVDFRGVFWTRFWTQVLLGLAAFAIFFAVIWANVELARRLAPDFRADVDGTLLEPRSPLVRKWVGIGGVVVSVVVAFIAGVSASGSWQQVLLYLNQAPWGQQDAQFGRDISFFVFSIPFWQSVLGFVLAALIVALVLAAIVHVIMGGIEIRQKAAGSANAGEAGPFARVQQSPQVPQVDVKLAGRAVAHLSALLAAVFVVVGIGQLFKAWDLVYSTAGAIYGAAYTDVVIRLPMARVTMVVAFVLAAALVWNALRRRRWWWGPLSIAVWIGALIVLRGIVPEVYQSLIVNPNQLSKEREYISRNLEATRQAYDLESIVQRRFEPASALTPKDLDENQPTLRNIRLWDPNTLVTSYRQLQELRPYYVFLDADIDRYTVNGAYRQTMLSARELSIEGLPEQAQTWVNQHITYTHGFGVAMSAVNQVTSDGSPDFLVQDIPPVSVSPELEIEQPRIYYGERGTEYSLVNTTEAEFDYPSEASTSWVPDTDKNAAIYAGGNFVGNWNTDLAPNGGAATLQIKTNGTVYNPKLNINPAVAGSGGVPPLSTVLPQATIDTLKAEAMAGNPTKANPGGTIADAALIAQLQRTSPQTYNATTDLVVDGDLKLGGGESWFNFRSLYVTGNLTLNGNTHTNATAIYVGGTFTISGPSGTSQFGPIYVRGNVNWGGALTIKTTDYTNPAAEPGPIYVGGSFTSAGGPFQHVFGPAYVQGAVTFSGNNAQILCPLLVSPGAITTSGSGGFGTVDDPMILLGIDDGTAATRAIQLSADAVLTGLVINVDGGVNLNNDGDGTFFIRGAVMSTGDVRFTNNGNVGYDPRALANLQITAATTTTTVVPGTWQELPAN